MKEELQKNKEVNFKYCLVSFTFVLAHLHVTFEKVNWMSLQLFISKALCKTSGFHLILYSCTWMTFQWRNAVKKVSFPSFTTAFLMFPALPLIFSQFLSSLPGLPAISHPGTIVHTHAEKAQINRLTECLWIMQRSFTAVGHKVCLLPNWCVKALKYGPVYLFMSSQGAESWDPPPKETPAAMTQNIQTSESR